jgi:WD40-like Beta Propeller Repeat
MFVTLATVSCGQTVNFPAPSLTSVSPASITTAEVNPFTLTVIGSGFVQQSIVQWNGISLQPLFVNTGELKVTIPPALFQAPGTATIVVMTPQPGGGTTQGILFTISPTTSPVPNISSLSPSSVQTGGSGVELQVMGTNFVTQSAVAVNGSRRTTTFVNSTLIETALSASDMATPGALQITVVNPLSPPPSGGVSNTFPLNVLNPFPTIASVSPTSAQAGSTPGTLTVTGTGFVGSQNSQISVNGVLRPTTFVSSTSLTTPLTGSDLLVAGVDQITVVTSTPGGGASNILTFPVTPTHLLGLPVLLDLAPNGSQANAGICGGMLSCDPGTPPKFTTVGPSTSTTGQFVAFASISNNLITNETNNGGIIFIRNTCVGVAACIPVTAAIGTDPNGNPANGASSEPAINAGASDAVFTSVATNLVTSVGAPVNTRQVYWRPTCLTANCVVTPTTFVTQIISVSADGLSAGNGDSYNPAISSDGEWVAFISLATNLVSNVTLDGVTPQVFLRETCGGVASETCTPTTFLVSTADGITPGNGPSSKPAVSEGGLFVSFTSTASNLGATAPNPSGAQEIFQRSTCVENTCTANTILISTPDGVTPADGASSESSISSTGQFVAFASTATNLEAGVGPTQQIYLRDTCLDITTTCTPSTTLISSTNGGIQGNGTSEYPSISSTGQYIAFASSSSNFASTTNGVENIFVNNSCVTSTTVTPVECTVSTALVTEGAGTPSTASNGNSLVPSISPDGTTVSFLSFASNLVPRDNNDFEDIFLGSTSFQASTTVEFTPQGAMRSAAARRSSQ